MSRREIFLRFQGQGINDMRLARQVAMLVTHRRRDECFLLNWLLIIAVVCLAIFMIATLEIRAVVYMPVMANGAVMAIVLVSIMHIVGFLRFRFNAYLSCTVFSALCIVIFAMVLWLSPVIASVGLLLAVVNLLLAMLARRELFPLMGLLDIRKASNGAFIFD